MCNYDRNQVEVAYIYHVAKFYDPIENILKVPMYIHVDTIIADFTQESVYFK